MISVFPDKEIQRTLRLEKTTLKLKQLGHFYRGKRSNDSAERYREFYQVLEDEGAIFNQDEIALRHAVSHPEITSQRYAPILQRIFGDTFFDPSNDIHLKIIGARADTLQARASSLSRNK